MHPRKICAATAPDKTAARSPTGGLPALNALNALPESSFQSLMHACCATSPFAQRMLAQRPFVTHESLFRTSDSACDQLRRADWLEAFAAHPRIGGACRAGGGTGALRPGARASRPALRTRRVT